MSEDSSINKDQRKEEDRDKATDFFGSVGKGMLAKEKIGTRGNSSGLTPLSYGVNFRKNTEMLSNSHGLSPFCPSGEIYSIKRKSIAIVEGFSANKGLEPVANSSGLTPLDFDSEPQIKPPRVTPLEGVSTSTVTPVDCVHTYASELAYVDGRPQGEQPLTYAHQGVHGVENPQGFGKDERRSDHTSIEKNPEVIETHGDLSGLSVPLKLCS